MAELHCPMCSKVNPDDLDKCQFCGARLKPLAPPSEGDTEPIHAGEKPTRKNTAELERALPSWLRSLREGKDARQAETPPEVPAEEPIAEQPSAPEESSGGSLDWLANLGASDSEDEEQVPDWLSGLRGASSPVSDLELPTSQPETFATSGSEPAEPSGDLLDRLGGIGNEPASAPPPKEQAEESTPDWLSRLEPVSEPTVPEITPQETPGEAAPGELSPALPTSAENLPDWLETMSPIAPAAKATTPEAGELPDWLSQLPETKPATTPAPAAEPKWLGESAVQDNTPGPESENSAQSTGQETPDWLSEFGVEAGSTAASIFSAEPPAKSETNEELPDWLSVLQADVNAASEAEKRSEQFEQASEPQGERPQEELPDWLSGVDLTVKPAAGAPALVIPESDETPDETGQSAFTLETPDWLSKLRPERPGTDVPASKADEATPDNLEAAELPSWVQAMRPVESVVQDAQAASPEEVETSEGSGPLTGLHAVLPVSPGLGAFRKPPAYAVKLQVNDNQQRYAAQLEKMVQDEGQSRASKPGRLRPNRIWRWAISIILIVAVLLPLTTGIQFTPDMDLYPSEWTGTSMALGGLPADAPMLVVFDYEPALSGELEAAAAPVIDRLLYQGARLTLVSTIPTGPALAEQFLQSTQAYHLQTGMLYTNLGYLPGGPTAISAFAADPSTTAPMTVGGDQAWQTPALQGVSRLSDFAALVILTDNADTGRVWIEQTQAVIGETPIFIIISAQAEPMIRPYYDSGQVQGLVTGLAGGMTYEQSFAAPGLARHYWDSFGLGALAIEIMIALGGLWGVVTAWRERKNKGTKA